MAKVICSMGTFRAPVCGSIRRPVISLLGLLAALLAAGGCEVDSFLDPTSVGRWERTPVVLPILKQIDAIDEPKQAVDGLTTVRPADLIPEINEYVIGPGDFVVFSIFELMAPNVDWVQGRRVDELGQVRLPVVDTLNVAGFTTSELEEELSDLLEERGILRDPTVAVTVQERRQNTFSVIGEPGQTSTSIGTFQILKPDFRLLDAMALARGVPGQTKKLFVIRQADRGVTTRKPDLVPGEGGENGEGEGGADTPEAEDLIGQLMAGIEPEEEGEEAPAALEAGLGDRGVDSPWVNVDGKWVKLDAVAQAARQTEEGADLEDIQVAQRVIEIPYDRLLEGDMRYNIVIRPGDIIRVPPLAAGNVYIGGSISRPGTYGLPGDNDLTLKQLVFSAGGLAGDAIPQRVDLTRRIGDDREATLRFNLAAIFDGTQPDIFLKTNDTINIGTNFFATHLATIRNSFRFSYGFGFILDRNFGRDVFGDNN